MLIGNRISAMAGGGDIPPGPTPAYWGLYFEAESPNVVVNMTKTGTPPTVSLETSVDGSVWTPFDADGGTTPVTLASIGDRVYFRAGSGGNVRISSHETYYRKFTLSGLCGAHGNIMSLLDGDNENNVTIASDATWCFARLFEGCTTLTSAPDLPATSLSPYCYRHMFYGCSALASVPATLPALTLPQQAYYRMFWQCRALTTAPIIEATEAGDEACDTMFYQCTNLTSLTIKITQIGSLGLSWMCNGCTNLNDVTVAMTTWGPSDATGSWLGRVAPTGTFTCPDSLGTNATIARGESFCPTGWNVINTPGYWGLYFEAEEANCVVNMNKYAATNTVSLECSTNGGNTWSDFDGNSNTGSTPVTLANVGDRVYFRTKGSTVGYPFSTGDMQYRYFTLSKKAGAHGNIMSLARGNQPTTTIPTAHYFYALFDSCANLTSAPDLPATTLMNSCYNSLFFDCSGLTTAPELPATTMKSSCYGYMFYGCTSLTTAPALPATSLTTYCYYSMFYGCTSLNSIEVHFTSWNAGLLATDSWVSGVPNSGTFYCPSGLGIAYGPSNCPSGWTVVNI